MRRNAISPMGVKAVIGRRTAGSRAQRHAPVVVRQRDGRAASQRRFGFERIFVSSRSTQPATFPRGTSRMAQAGREPR